MKQIKFNLRCDGKSIRSIEALRENFNIEDVMENFENGQLLKWLECRDYKEEFDDVKTLMAEIENDKSKTLNFG